MKDFRRWFSRARRDIRLAELAEDIADRSFEPIWQRVVGRVLVLAPAEARGYVRARARGLLQQEVMSENLGDVWQRRTYALAMDATLRRVATQAHALRLRREVRSAA